MFDTGKIKRSREREKENGNKREIIKKKNGKIVSPVIQGMTQVIDYKAQTESNKTNGTENVRLLR